jgi:hypothetical protein
MFTRALVGWIAAAFLLSLVQPAVVAQTPAQTASDFYMSYRTAFDKAKKIEELFPYMAKSMRAEVDETPAAERAKMFEIVKIMGALTNLKIVRETKTADGATLTVEALDSDKKKTTGKIDIVRENGVWKLGGESWSSQF